MRFLFVNYLTCGFRHENRNDLNNQFYFYATDHLMSMKEQGMVDQIGLFGFSAECMKSLIAEEAPVVTNQVRIKHALLCSH